VARLPGSPKFKRAPRGANGAVAEAVLFLSKRATLPGPDICVPYSDKGERWEAFVGGGGRALHLGRGDFGLGTGRRGEDPSTFCGPSVSDAVFWTRPETGVPCSGAWLFGIGAGRPVEGGPRRKDLPTGVSFLGKKGEYEKEAG